MATAVGRKGRAKPTGRGKVAKAAKAPAEPRRRLTWFTLTLGVVGTMLALRLGVNALELAPAGAAEAEYLAKGRAPDWGYFTTPPLVPALLALATDLLDDTLFALRLPSAAAHALAGWMIFLTGAHLWGGRTGFWAAAGYTLAPGVAFSSMLAMIDPVLMAAWAVALYALVRGLGAQGSGWWIAAGLALGAGFNASYAMLAFPLAVLVFLMTSSEAERRDWRGFGIACAIGLIALVPNMIWQAGHGFAGLRHLIAGVLPGETSGGLAGLGLFAGVQLALAGPFLIALVPALLSAGRWRQDWGMRLMAWLSAPVLALMLGLAFLGQAAADWAAPAYVGLALLSARWLLDRGWRGWLAAQLGLGATVTIVLWTAAALYAVQAGQLPAAGDPFRGARLGPVLCERALGAMDDENATVLLSTDRQTLSACMVEGNLGWDEMAIWNPGLAPRNQHELVGTLRAGDGRRMVLAVPGDGARIAARFARQGRVEAGRIATHRDRAVAYQIWIVEGFEDYGDAR